MKDIEFRAALVERQKNLGLSYKDIQQRTQLGYNTLRRVFNNPTNCRLSSVIRVVTALGCSLDFAIEQQIADELEPDVSIEPLTQKEADEL